MSRNPAAPPTRMFVVRRIISTDDVPCFVAVRAFGVRPAAVEYCEELETAARRETCPGSWLRSNGKDAPGFAALVVELGLPPYPPVTKRAHRREVFAKWWEFVEPLLTPEARMALWAGTNGPAFYDIGELPLAD